MQLWTTTVASARAARRQAQEIEAAGWHGMFVVDLQNLSGDPYVSLALAATVTTRLGLGTGVTNSITRHAAATATAITVGPSPVKRPCGAGHRPRRFSACPSRPSAGAAEAVRALPAAAPGLSRRRRRCASRRSTSRRVGAADVGTASARCAAVEPHRLDRRRAPEGRGQGAGRGGGERSQGDRDVGAACRAGDVHAGRRRRAPAWGIDARQEDAQATPASIPTASPSAPT